MAKRQTKRLNSGRRPKRADDVLDEALATVRGGAVPNVDGHKHLGTLVFEDPYERDGQSRLVRRTKVVNTRDDPVGWMYQHGQLARDDDRDPRDAEMRLMAARQFERLYERAEIGGAKAMDFTRDAVDGGQIQTPDAMLCQEAQQALKPIWRLLGKYNSNLVRRVLCEKRTLVEVAAGLLGIDVPEDRREQSTLTKSLVGNFLLALNELADHFGVRPQRGARGPRRERDRWDKLAPLAAIHPELAKAERRAQEER